METDLSKVVDQKKKRNGDCSASGLFDRWGGE